MGITRTYSLSNVRLVVGGVLVNGFADDDAFSWDWSGDLWTRTTGQDGDNVYGRNLERVAQGRITLLGTSRAYTTLYTLLERQSGDSIGIVPALLLPMQFALNDAHTGDVLSSNTCMFMRRPAPSKGRNNGNAVFPVELPNARFVAGARNVLQAGI